MIEAGADGEAALWAAAGQNGLSKGTLAGTVRWHLEGGILSVTYDPDEGFILTEAHLYVGAERPAEAAPRQLGYNAGEMDNVSGHTLAGAVRPPCQFSGSVVPTASCSCHWKLSTRASES